MFDKACFYKTNFIFIFKQVEEPSPQVSSIFRNLRLNNLAPRQLFKPTDNQETGQSAVVDHTKDPSNQETEMQES